MEKMSLISTKSNDRPQLLQCKTKVCSNIKDILYSANMTGCEFSSGWCMTGSGPPMQWLTHSKGCRLHRVRYSSLYSGSQFSLHNTKPCKNTNPQSIPLQQLNQNLWGLDIISLKSFPNDSNVWWWLKCSALAPDQPEPFSDFAGALAWLLINASPK